VSWVGLSSRSAILALESAWSIAVSDNSESLSLSLSDSALSMLSRLEGFLGEVLRWVMTNFDVFFLEPVFESGLADSP
jgi:hypothetical protein